MRRSDLDDDALEALAGAWRTHGVQAIRTVREQDPARYIKIIAAVSAPSLRRDDEEGELDHEAVLAIRDAVCGRRGRGR
jgi:hypothetical protein